MWILGDKDFEDEYGRIIAPFNDECCRSGYYTSQDGKNMHCLAWVNPDAKANVIAVHGFTECAQKLDEMAYYFYNLGYSVYAPDLRGHGLSYKDKAPQYGVDSLGFGFYADDLASLYGCIDDRSLPLYAFTHSLGGNAMLLCLMQSGLPVQKLVLSSPMICGDMGMPVPMAFAVSRLLTAIGLGGTPAPGRCVFVPEKGNPDAADTARAWHQIKFKAENPEYQTCGPDFRWVMNSVKACRELLDEKNIEKLTCDMLVIRPELDGQLLEKPQDEFIGKCRALGKSIRCERLMNSRHEIFQSGSEVLRKYVDLISEFYLE